MTEGKFPHWETPHGGLGGTSGLRGEPSNRCSGGKTERIHHRDLAKQHFPVEKWPEGLPVRGGWASRPRLRGSDPGERMGDYHEDALRLA